MRSSTKRKPRGLQEVPPQVPLQVMATHQDPETDGKQPHSMAPVPLERTYSVPVQRPIAWVAILLFPAGSITSELSSARRGDQCSQRMAQRQAP